MKEIIARKCPMCGTMTKLEVESSQLEAYDNGALIQDAFPDSDAFTRECIKTGFCFDCISKTFNCPKPGDTSWGECIGDCPYCGSPIWSIKNKQTGDLYKCGNCGVSSRKGDLE